MMIPNLFYDVIGLFAAIVSSSAPIADIGTQPSTNTRTPRSYASATIAFRDPLTKTSNQESVPSGKSGQEARYLGQKPPGNSPQKFAPGIASRSDVHEFGSTFTSDGLTYYYGVDLNGRAEIRSMRFENKKWSEPKTLIHHAQYSFNDPMLSPDEKRLYFISDRPLNGVGAKKDYDIWYVEKTKSGWSEPINPGPAINSKRNEYYISFARDGSLYFGSNVDSKKNSYDFDLYVSRFADGKFQPAKRLDGQVNSNQYEADVFVAPNESFVIFSSSRKGSLGRGDLFISFRQNDRKDGAAQWSKAINMGPKINTQGHELCPFISADGKYLFYTSEGDIYWVSTSIIKELQK